MNAGARFWRVLAGSAVLVALIALALLLLPVYYRNLQFEGGLKEIARASESGKRSDEVLRAVVVDRAARLGLPIQAGDIRLIRSPGRLRIEVHYKVPVDLSLYSVELHFNPSAP